MKRRKFIHDNLAAGAGMVLSPALARLPVPGFAAAKKKVIIAGAGITGLCCGYELMKLGHEVTILEASGRYGGHVYTGRDGLSDGLYADFGADHITKPGYEKFFEYAAEFNLTPIPYPNAEGSDAAYDKDKRSMIGGKWYTAGQLHDPVVLKAFGFNDKEAQFLTTGDFDGLRDLYLHPYLDKFTDPYQPFGVGYDDFDHLPVADLYKKEGASAAALRFMGGRNTNALYALWRLSLMHSRGIPLNEGETFHLKDGNEQLPIAFASRLGHRVLLNHPVTAVHHNPQGVTVTYRPYNKTEEQLSADALVVCITLPVFRNIPVTPALSPEKQFVVDNLGYSSHPFYVFEAASKFWLDDGIPSINMEFEHPDISGIWSETNQVQTERVILKAYGPGGLSPQRVLA
ncbi:MAG TPA: NAD(P)/FAD-dependent oxidoreductase, partial [Puia sp.]|nr:NAD(P)/FAD-dependent oxidoreductase [Puia sp.]